MSDANNFGLAVAMSVDVLMRSLGGSQVMLRLPVIAMNTSGEQLGLSVPAFQDLLLSPVTICQLRNSECAVLVGTSAMESAAKSLSHGSVTPMLKNICGVLVGDVLMSLVAVEGAGAGDVPYLYRLRLRTLDA